MSKSRTSDDRTHSKASQCCPSLLSQRSVHQQQKTMVKLRSYINRSYLSNTSSYSMSKNRTRSISPRRNHWREEIRTMRSWKDDGSKGSKMSRKLGDGSSPMSASDKSFCRNIVKAAKDWNSNMFKKENLENDLVNCRNEKNAPLKRSVHSENSISLSNDKDSMSVVDKDKPQSKRKPKMSPIPAPNDSSSKMDSSLHVKAAKTDSKVCSPSQPARDELGRNFSLLELKMEVYTTRLKELEWEREQLILDREKEKIVKTEKRENCEEKRVQIPNKKPEKDVIEGTRKEVSPDDKDKLVKEKKPKIIEKVKSKLPDKKRDKVKDRRSTSSSISKHANSSLDTLCIY